MRKATVLTLLLVALAAGSALAMEWHDPCDTTDHMWVTPPAMGTLQATGGNPDGWWQYGGWSFLAPRSLFDNANPDYFPVGNWRLAGVTEFSVDIQVVASSGPVSAVPVYFFLYMNAQGDFEDMAVQMASTVATPEITDGWVTMTFPVDAQATDLPAGWEWVDPTPNNPPPAYDWNEIIQNVDMIGVSFGPFNDWPFNLFTTVGLDNLRITYEETPVAVESTTLSGVKALFD